MKKISVIFLLFTYLSGSLLSAENDKKKPAPDVSIGINANYGRYDMYSRNMDLSNKPGVYTGGGITVEKMTDSSTGIISGLQYRYFNSDFVMNDGTYIYDATWTYQSFNIPFLLFYSVKGENTGVNFAAGVVYSHIFYSMMKTDTTYPIDTNKDNALKYTHTNQLGLSAGITVKIKTAQFTDFFIGVTGEFYPTNLLYKSGGSSDSLNMINYSLTTGYMFRTALF